MNQTANKQTAGFTLVELTLALVFISALLMAVVFLTMSLSQTYSRGITIKALNQVGREVSDQLRRDFLSATPAEVKFVDVQQSGRSKSGRLCLGRQTYVWTDAKSVGKDLTTEDVVKYVDAYNTPKDQVVFARVNDPGATLCVLNAASGKYPMTVKPTDAKELFDQASYGLVIHGLAFNDKLASSPNTGQRLFGVSLTIGTRDLSAIDSANQQCKPPADATSDVDYCSINTFDMILKTGTRD